MNQHQVKQRPEIIGKWHDAVASNDMNAIESMLADDAVFMSPAVYAPQQGKAVTARYLRAALAVLNGQGFRYVGEWLSPHSAVLEFEADFDGTHVNGVDMIHWNEAGQITLFKVMVRPLRGLNMLIPLMGEELKKGAA